MIPAAIDCLKFQNSRLLVDYAYDAFVNSLMNRSSRKTYDLNDFVVILEKMDRISDSYKFITAYPVFHIRQQDEFDKAYVRHKENQKRLLVAANSSARKK